MASKWNEKEQGAKRRRSNQGTRGTARTQPASSNPNKNRKSTDTNRNSGRTAAAKPAPKAAPKQTKPKTVYYRSKDDAKPVYKNPAKTKPKTQKPVYYSKDNARPVSAAEYNRNKKTGNVRQTIGGAVKRAVQANASAAKAKPAFRSRDYGKEQIKRPGEMNVTDYAWQTQQQDHKAAHNLSNQRKARQMYVESGQAALQRDLAKLDMRSGSDRRGKSAMDRLSIDYKTGKWYWDGKEMTQAQFDQQFPMGLSDPTAREMAEKAGYIVNTRYFPTKEDEKDKKQEIGWVARNMDKYAGLEADNVSDADAYDLMANRRKFAQAQAAGDKEAMARYHQANEDIRAKYGYSGGTAGDQILRGNVSANEYAQLNETGDAALSNARRRLVNARTPAERERIQKEIDWILTNPENQAGEENKHQIRDLTKGSVLSSIGNTAVQLRNIRDMNKYAGADDAYNAVPKLWQRVSELYDQMGNTTDEKQQAKIQKQIDWLTDQATAMEQEQEKWATDPNSPYFDPTVAERLGMPTSVQPNRWDEMAERGDQLIAGAKEGMNAGQSFAADLYSNAIQMIPTTAAGLIPGVGGASVGAKLWNAARGAAQIGALSQMGLAAGGARYRELVDRNVPRDQARTDALLATAIEMGTEALPLHYMGKLVGGAQRIGRTIPGAIAASAAIEGGEEGVSYAANALWSWMRGYEQDRFDWGEMGKSMLAGGIMGGLHAGLGVAVNRAVTHLTSQGREQDANRVQAYMDDIDGIMEQSRQYEEMVRQGALSAEEGAAIQSQLQQDLVGKMQSIQDHVRTIDDQTPLLQVFEDGMQRNRERSVRAPAASVPTPLAANETPVSVNPVEQAERMTAEALRATDVEMSRRDAVAQLQAETPPITYERSGLPPTSFLGAAIDARREARARAEAEAQVRMDQEIARQNRMAAEQRSFVPNAAAQNENVPVSYQNQQVQQPASRLEGLASTFGESGAASLRTIGGKMVTGQGAFARDFTDVYNQVLGGRSESQVSRPAGMSDANYFAAVTAAQNDRQTGWDLDILKASKAAGRNVNAGVDWRDQYVRQMDRKTARTVDGLAKALGVKVVFAEKGSILTAGGTAANAEITGNVVRIEKDNPNPVRMLIGHELTHRMQDVSPESYRAFRDYAMSVPGSMEALERTVSLYQKAGAFRAQDNARQMAMDEVTADFAGSLLENSEQLQEFIRRNYENRTMLEVIRDFFRDLAAKLTGRQKAQADEAVRLLEEAIKGASKQLKQNERQGRQGDNNRSREGLAGEGEAIDPTSRMSLSSMGDAFGFTAVVDQETGGVKYYRVNGRQVKRVTTRDVKQSKMYQLVDLARQNGTISAAEAEKQATYLRRLMNLVLKTNDSEMIYAFEGSMLWSAVKDNADKQYGMTIDFEAICKKTEQMVAAMSEAMTRKGRGLTLDEINELYGRVIEAGEPVPCPPCYVFTRWIGLGGLLDNIKSFQTEFADTEAGTAKARKRLDEIRGILSDEIADLRAEDDARVKKNLEAQARGEKKTKRDLEPKSDDDLTNQAKKARLAELDKAEGKLITKRNKALNKLQFDNLSEAERRKVQASIDAIDEEYNDLTNQMRILRMYSWLKDVRLSDTYKEVPDSVLFNLRAGEEFASRFADTWAFRTGQGAYYGKAITPYTDMRTGEIIQGVHKSARDIKIGKANPFSGEFDARNLTKKQAEELDSARLKVRQQNMRGGVRMQSVSDFRYEYGLDYIQAFFELQSIGAAVQTYSKVVEFVPMVASTGGFVNMSLIPWGTGFRNGKLAYSSVTGMDAEAAFNLQKQWDTAGTILIGVSDEHIRAAMADNDIYFIIPYHLSGGREDVIRQMLTSLGEKAEKYTDYSNVQSEKFPSQQNPVLTLRNKILTASKTFDPTRAEQALLDSNEFLRGLYDRKFNRPEDPLYMLPMMSEDTKHIYPYEYWDVNSTYKTADVNGQRYLQWCEDLGVVPKFSGDKDGNKDFRNDKGYWKLLIDRRMYGRDGRYNPLTPINATGLNLNQLDRERARQTFGEAMTAPADLRKTKEIVDKAFPETAGKRFSITPQADADYMAAVESGDMETAQRMVDEAAKKNGYTIKAYHGTPSTNTEKNQKYISSVLKLYALTHPNEPQISEPGDYGTDSYKKFWAFANLASNVRWLNRLSKAYNVPENLKHVIKLGPTRNFTSFNVNSFGHHSKAANETEIGAYFTTDEEAAYAFTSTYEYDPLLKTERKTSYGNGYIYNVYLKPDNAIKRKAQIGGRNFEEIVVKDARDIKSADPVTYDDNGDVIPLSERFNAETGDIRYSITPEAIDPVEITPVNEVRDRGMYDYLVSDFKENGWNGRPLVVVENGNNGYLALTGSHRIAAAMEADIDVPAIVLDYDDDILRLLDANDDDERESIARELAEDGTIPQDVADLIIRENDLNFENWNVPYKDRKRYSIGTEGYDRARLMRENQELKEKLEYWRGQVKKSDRTKADPKEVRKLANSLRTDYSTEMDAGEITQRLQAIYDGIGKDWSYDRAYEEAGKLARDMIEQATETDDYLYNENEPLRKFFKDTALVVTPEIRRAIPDYNEWRKAQFGKLRLQSGDQTNIDQVFQEAAALWPEWFSEEVSANSLDQLERIADVMGGIYSRDEVNPFGDDIAGPAGYLTTQIMDSFWDVPSIKKTFADRAEARLGREVTRRLDMKERYENALQKVREQRDRKLREQSQRYLTAKRKNSQKQKERELRAKIVRHVNKLSTKLTRPTDTQHIPEALVDTVRTALESINLASKDMKDTKRTQAFAALQKMYQEMEKNGSEVVIDPDLIPNISDIIGFADTPIANLGLEDLNTIWQTVRAIEASISTFNKALGRAKFETISQPAFGIRDYLTGRKDRGDYRGPFRQMDRLLNFNMLTPEAYFLRLGNSGKEVFRMLRDAQDRHITIMDQAQRKTREIVGKTDIKKLEKEKHTFTFDGQTVELTTAQIMSLHELMKRQQAVDHVMIGGIRPESVKKGIKDLPPARPWHLTQDQVSEVVDSLTAEQVKLADELQKYMGGTMAELGNEASMEVYGYRKFTEKHYFPISVDKNQTQSDVKNDAVSGTIAGWGSARPVKPNANNAVILRSIFDVYADHVTEMANYASWLAPMENMNRIFNFRYKDEEGHQTGTMKAQLESLFGKNGEAYWKQLQNDLNNGVHGRDDSPFSAFMGTYKASAIGANIRVIAQQPTAILRAMDSINPADFIAGMARARWGKFDDIVKQYAPIAIWKDWGYFQQDTGRQMRNVLFNDDTKLRKVNSAMMWGAGKADSLSWTAIWNALESETRRKRKDLRYKSREFYEAVAERFNEVVDHTQVVDGILQRSQIMRSADGLTKMATSFMAEPTKTYNMMLSAIYEARNAKGRERSAAMGKLAKTAFALTVSITVNAAAQSLVDAIRDDDKDEDYWEKFIQAYFGLEGDTRKEQIKNGILNGNLEAAFNPLTYIPYLKDIVSQTQGYSVSRMDMDTISRVLKAFTNVEKAMSGEGKNTKQSAWLNLTAEIARFLGVPAANIKRDVQTILRTFFAGTGNYRMLYEQEKFLYDVTSKNTLTEFSKLILGAERAGDDEAAQAIRQDMIDSGVDAEKIDKKLAELRKKAVTDTEEFQTALAQKTDAYHTMLEADTRFSGLAEDTQENVRKQLDGYAQYQVLGESMDVDNDKMEKIAEAESHGVPAADWVVFKAVAKEIHGDDRKEQVLKLIDSYAVSNEGKSYMYLSQNYSEKANPYQ